MVRLMHMTLTEPQAQGPQRPEESIRAAGTGVTGCYELLVMGAGN